VTVNIKKSKEGVFANPDPPHFYRNCPVEIKDTCEGGTICWNICDYPPSTPEEEVVVCHWDCPCEDCKTDPWYTSHDGINVDNPSRPYYEPSYRDAYYASRQWIQLTKSWVSPQFWDTVQNSMNNNTPFSQGYLSEKKNDFMHYLWYTGTWNAGFSESKDDTFFYWLADSPEEWSDENVILFGLFDKTAWQVYDPSFKVIPHSQEYQRIPQVRWLKIQTRRVWKTDEDAFDIDTNGEADFYPIITVGNQQHIDAPYEDKDDVSSVNWVSLHPISRIDPAVKVHYSIKDDEGAWRVDEDCDINPAGNSNLLSLTIPRGEEKTITSVNPDNAFEGDENEAGVTLDYRFAAADLIADRFEPNDEKIHAADFLPGDYPGLTSHNETNEDWYKISLPGGFNDLDIELNYDRLRGALNSEVRCGDKDWIGEPTETTTGDRIHLENVNYPLCYLAISPQDALPNTYDLHLDVKPSKQGSFFEIKKWKWLWDWATPRDSIK
jgi:hypothetical protein